jgi:hypothetical protein
MKKERLDLDVGCGVAADDEDPDTCDGARGE